MNHSCNRDTPADTARPLFTHDWRISSSETLTIPNSRLIWTKTFANSETSSSEGSRCSQVQRQIVGYGGEIDRCGALRLTESGGDEDAVEGERAEGRTGEHRQDYGNDTIHRDVEAPASSSPDWSDSHMTPTPSVAATSSLFDVDFDIKLDEATGRWMISNVNVLRRS